MMSQSDRPFPTETAAVGPWGGPVYGYRGAEIRCAKGGHVCALLMLDHPLHGQTFGVLGTITLLIDLWVEERRLPSYMRATPKAGAEARGEAAALQERAEIRAGPRGG
jgi:hypothetical protein